MGRMYFVTILARPSQDNARVGVFGGAYVNCWIEESSERAAIARAEKEVRAASWAPESIRSACVVTSDTYREDGEGREYFEQALIDGVVLVFHTFPDDGLEDDTLH